MKTIKILTFLMSCSRFGCHLPPRKGCELNQCEDTAGLQDDRVRSPTRGNVNYKFLSGGRVCEEAAQGAPHQGVVNSLDISHCNYKIQESLPAGIGWRVPGKGGTLRSQPRPLHKSVDENYHGRLSSLEESSMWMG